MAPLVTSPLSPWGRDGVGHLGGEGGVGNGCHGLGVLLLALEACAGGEGEHGGEPAGVLGAVQSVGFLGRGPG